ncbi:winged helix-turn-helix domain-containing protein [Frondihabitans australicus]|uniref:Helix-turn-helix protein n=1 Tax=Frondihabitans australicus TaxID=386892 RepID=A0A495IGW7_9MICO|nr:helix-turn-helix domain-containing protein [Frondihabitans australicus]RKR74920.1 helix-turn-helix protein [Frondihabitans australicus]
MTNPTFCPMEPTRGLTDAQIVAVSPIRARIVTALSGRAALAPAEMLTLIPCSPRALHAHLRILARRDIIRGISGSPARGRDAIDDLYYLV